MTKDDWIDKAAAEFARQAAMNPEQADVAARACWDWTVECAGSEDAVLADLAEWGPEGAVSEEMSCWTDDEPAAA
ncbi:hypothetical protein ACJ41P_10340 [Azospirillum argentinense]|uniref:Uncharacterized protein n=1 Tax=Azospirillum argentinense TaxID=2970906 RepID=A0ABW8V576_9PROT